MQTDTDPYIIRLDLIPVRSEQSLLGSHRCPDTAYTAFEHGVKTISGGFDNGSVIFLNGTDKDFIMSRQGGLHRLGESLPEFCAVFNIGKKEGDRSRRKIVCHGIPVNLKISSGGYLISTRTSIPWRRFVVPH